MRAIRGNHRMRTTRRLAGIGVAAVLALSALGGTVQAIDTSRIFTVTVSDPSPVSAGGSTWFSILVDSDDNQTIANVVLKVPASGAALPSGLSISAVFGADAGLCPLPPYGASLTCDLGNIAAYDTRSISVVVDVDASMPSSDAEPPPDPITFSASAETNNENGANVQIVTGTSGALHVTAFDPDSLTTFKLTGSASTGPLGTGNFLQTTLNLLEDNGGNGNAIVITEGTDTTQPEVCIARKLTCQPYFSEVDVNGGQDVSPYLETILTANVPKSYNIKKAFVIHVVDGSVESGFPIYNLPDNSCAVHPVPCADFSLTKAGVLTIIIHTLGNGKFQY